MSGVVGVSTSGSVLRRGEVAQSRMAVPMVVHVVGTRFHISCNPCSSLDHRPSSSGKSGKFGSLFGRNSLSSMCGEVAHRRNQGSSVNASTWAGRMARKCL
jgi:hypothetical protein